MSNSYGLSDNQITLLKTALQAVRDAQIECENIDHAFYKAADELQYSICDVLDEEESE